MGVEVVESRSYSPLSLFKLQRICNFWGCLSYFYVKQKILFLLPKSLSSSFALTIQRIVFTQILHLFQKKVPTNVPCQIIVGLTLFKDR